MRHFVSYFNDSVKKHWDLPALTNFGKETFTYGQMAGQIAKYHILFSEAGIKKGDYIGWVEIQTASGGLINKSYIVSCEDAEEMKASDKKGTFIEKLKNIF